MAGELELRWNDALRKARDLEARLDVFDAAAESVVVPDKELLVNLAHNLPAVWNASSTNMRLKQRIVRILVHEIVADVDEKASEVVLLLHWAGGRHSELRIKKNATGKHRCCTAVETIDVIRQMAARFSDEQIATTLNRLGLRTGTGHTWNEGRVKSARNYHHLPTYDAKRQDGRILTLEQVALRLGISTASVRRMIEQKKLPAAQVVACAPWQISAESLETEAVRQAVRNIKSGVRRPRTHIEEQQPSMFSGVS